MYAYNPECNCIVEEDPGIRKRRLKRMRRRRWGRRLTAVLECFAMADPMAAAHYMRAKEGR